ncbi:hypothetical protein L9F63_014160, partial [Diploptera punctata]
NAVKSIKQMTKNLADMTKELETISNVTCASDLPEKLQEAEEAKVDVETQLQERNSLLQETSEEWEQCEKKMKDVRSWIEKSRQALESPQNKKRPLKDQLTLREKITSDINVQKTKITISVEKLQVHFRSGIGGDTKVSESVKEIIEELDQLSAVVKEQSSTLETCLSQVDQYQQEIQQIRQQIIEVEQQLRVVLSPTYSPHDRDKAVEEQNNLNTESGTWKLRISWSKLKNLWSMNTEHIAPRDTTFSHGKLYFVVPRTKLSSTPLINTANCAVSTISACRERIVALQTKISARNELLPEKSPTSDAAVCNINKQQPQSVRHLPRETEIKDNSKQVIIRETTEENETGATVKLAADSELVKKSHKSRRRTRSHQRKDIQPQNAKPSNIEVCPVKYSNQTTELPCHEVRLKQLHVSMPDKKQASDMLKLNIQRGRSQIDPEKMSNIKQVDNNELIISQEKHKGSVEWNVTTQHEMENVTKYGQPEEVFTVSEEQTTFKDDKILHYESLTVDAEQFVPPAVESVSYATPVDQDFIEEYEINQQDSALNLVEPELAPVKVKKETAKTITAKIPSNDSNLNQSELSTPKKKKENKVKKEATNIVTPIKAESSTSTILQKSKNVSDSVSKATSDENKKESTNKDHKPVSQNQTFEIKELSATSDKQTDLTQQKRKKKNKKKKKAEKSTSEDEIEKALKEIAKMVSVQEISKLEKDYRKKRTGVSANRVDEGSLQLTETKQIETIMPSVTMQSEEMNVSNDTNQTEILKKQSRRRKRHKKAPVIVQDTPTNDSIQDLEITNINKTVPPFDPVMDLPPLDSEAKKVSSRKNKKGHKKMKKENSSQNSNKLAEKNILIESKEKDTSEPQKLLLGNEDNYQIKNADNNAAEPIKISPKKTKSKSSKNKTSANKYNLRKSDTTSTELGERADKENLTGSVNLKTKPIKISPKKTKSKSSKNKTSANKYNSRKSDTTSTQLEGRADKENLTGSVNLKTSGVSTNLGEIAVTQNFVESVTSTTGVKENLKEADTSTIPVKQKLTKSITSTKIVTEPQSESIVSTIPIKETLDLTESVIPAITVKENFAESVDSTKPPAVLTVTSTDLEGTNTKRKHKKNKKKADVHEDENVAEIATHDSKEDTETEDVCVSVSDNSELTQNLDTVVLTPQWMSKSPIPQNAQELVDIENLTKSTYDDGTKNSDIPDESVVEILETPEIQYDKIDNENELIWIAESETEIGESQIGIQKPQDINYEIEDKEVEINLDIPLSQRIMEIPEIQNAKIDYEIEMIRIAESETQSVWEELLLSLIDQDKTKINLSRSFENVVEQVNTKTSDKTKEVKLLQKQSANIEETVQSKSAIPEQFSEHVQKLNEPSPIKEEISIGGSRFIEFVPRKEMRKRRSRSHSRSNYGEKPESDSQISQDTVHSEDVKPSLTQVVSKESEEEIMATKQTRKSNDKQENISRKDQNKKSRNEKGTKDKKTASENEHPAKKEHIYKWQHADAECQWQELTACSVKKQNSKTSDSETKHDEPHDRKDDSDGGNSEILVLDRYESEDRIAAEEEDHASRLAYRVAEEVITDLDDEEDLFVPMLPVVSEVQLPSLREDITANYAKMKEDTDSFIRKQSLEKSMIFAHVMHLYFGSVGYIYKQNSIISSLSSLEWSHNPVVDLTSNRNDIENVTKDVKKPRVISKVGTEVLKLIKFTEVKEKEQMLKKAASLTSELEDLERTIDTTEIQMSNLPLHNLISMSNTLMELNETLKSKECDAVKLEDIIRDLPQDAETKTLEANLAGVKTRIITLVSQAEQGRNEIEIAKGIVDKRIKDITQYQILLSDVQQWLLTVKAALSIEIRPTSVEDITEQQMVYQKLAEELENIHDSTNEVKTRHVLLQELICVPEHKTTPQNEEKSPVGESLISHHDDTIASDASPIPEEEALIHSSIPVDVPLGQEPIVLEVGSQTGSSLVLDIDIQTDLKSMSPVKAEPVMVSTGGMDFKSVQTQKDTWTSPAVELHKSKIHVVQKRTGDEETIEIATRTAVSQGEDKAFLPDLKDDLLVEVKYKDKDKDKEDTKTSELNIVHTSPQSFETVMMDPDDTTTEVIVDKDGNKRIIVRKVRRTIVTQHHTVQERQLFTSSDIGFDGSQIPTTQSLAFAQTTLESQEKMSRKSQGDGTVQVTTTKSYAGHVAEGVPGGDVTVSEFSSEPQHETVTYVTRLQSQHGDTESYSVVEPDGDTYVTSSSVQAVVQQVTRKVIKQTRRIIRKVVIIDGKEQTIEEIIEEPDDEVTEEEQVPRIQVKVTRSKDGKVEHETYTSGTGDAAEGPHVEYPSDEPFPVSEMSVFESVIKAERPKETYVLVGDAAEEPQTEFSSDKPVPVSEKSVIESIIKPEGEIRDLDLKQMSVLLMEAERFNPQSDRDDYKPQEEESEPEKLEIVKILTTEEHDLPDETTPSDVVTYTTVHEYKVPVKETKLEEPVTVEISTENSTPVEKTQDRESEVLVSSIVITTKESTTSPIERTHEEPGKFADVSLMKEFDVSKQSVGIKHRDKLVNVVDKTFPEILEKIIDLEEQTQQIITGTVPKVSVKSDEKEHKDDETTEGFTTTMEEDVSGIPDKFSDVKVFEETDVLKQSEDEFTSIKQEYVPKKTKSLPEKVVKTIEINLSLQEEDQKIFEDKVPNVESIPNDEQEPKVSPKGILDPKEASLLLIEAEHTSSDMPALHKPESVDMKDVTETGVSKQIDRKKSEHLLEHDSKRSQTSPEHSVKTVEIAISLEESIPEGVTEVIPKVSSSVKIDESEDKTNPDLKTVKEEIKINFPVKTEEIHTVIEDSKPITDAKMQSDASSVSESSIITKKGKKKKKPKSGKMKESSEESVESHPRKTSDDKQEMEISVESSLAESTEIIIPRSTSSSSDTTKPTEQEIAITDIASPPESPKETDKSLDTGYEPEEKLTDESSLKEERKKRKKKKKQQVKIKPEFSLSSIEPKSSGEMRDQSSSEVSIKQELFKPDDTDRDVSIDERNVEKVVEEPRLPSRGVDIKGKTEVTQQSIQTITPEITEVSDVTTTESCIQTNEEDSTQTRTPELRQDDKPHISTQEEYVQTNTPEPSPLPETPILEMDTLDKSLLKEEIVPESIQTDIPEIPSKVVETFEISSQTPATTTSEDAVQTFNPEVQPIDIQEIASQTNNEELNVITEVYSKTSPEIEPVEIQEIASQNNKEELNPITDVYSQTSPDMEPIEIQEIASQANKEELNQITDDVQSQTIEPGKTEAQKTAVQTKPEDQSDKVRDESQLEVPEEKSEPSPEEKSMVIVHPTKPSSEEITEERGSVEVLPESGSVQQVERGSVEVLPESGSGIVLQLAQVSQDLLLKESDRISFDISDSLRDEPLIHHVKKEGHSENICEITEEKEEIGSVEVLPESSSGVVLQLPQVSQDLLPKEFDRIAFDISDSLTEEPLHSSEEIAQEKDDRPVEQEERDRVEHSSEEIAQEKDDKPVEQEERDRVEVDPESSSDIVLQLAQVTQDLLLKESGKTSSDSSDSVRHEPVKQFVEMEDQFDKICGESQLQEPEEKSELSLEEKSVVVAHPTKHSSEKIIQENDGPVEQEERGRVDVHPESGSEKSVVVAHPTKHSSEKIIQENDGPVEQEERGRVDVHPESGSESGKTSFDTPKSLTEQVITHIEKEDQSDKFYGESQFEPSSEEITQVEWNKANNIISKRIKNLQNAKETTHMSGILCLATLEEIVTEESVEQQSENVQRNLNLLRSAVETKDVVFIQKTVITTIETISTWLQTIEYRVYLSRQNMNTSPSVDKVKEYNDLRAEISHIEESVGELGGVLDTASEICNNEDKIKMHEYITTLKDQMKAVEEMAQQNEQKVTNDLTHWEEFLNGVNNIHVLVQELKQKFEDLVQSDVSAKAKLVELEEIESVNRCHMGKTIRLLSTARNLIKEFPGCDIPPETMTAHETTKILEHNIILERERLFHLLSLIEDYEQTMKELSQIIDIADVLVESPICVVSLEHLQEEMQKHRKFFVNLSHCRGILESLEQNLDPDTCASYSQLHQALHCRATVILDKAAYRAQQMAMAASRWTVLEQGMKEETGWLQVAHQRVPDLQSVNSSDYDQYINLYQTLSSDVAVHHARIIQLLSIAHRLQELVTCLGLEARYDEHLETILKLQDDVNTNLQRLLTFRDTWTSHEVMINKLEYWMREVEQDLDAMSAHNVITGGNMRQFWELKAQYEVHNNIHNEAATTFESAIKIIPVADEVVQRQLNAELENRWKEVANRIHGIQDSLMQNISAQDVPLNNKLSALEKELQEIKSTLDDFHGVIKNEEDLDLYIERLQVLHDRVGNIEEELGRLGLLSATETEKVSAVLSTAHELDMHLLEELEELAPSWISVKLGSDVVEQAVINCQAVGQELKSYWQDLMALRQLLHTLPMSLRLTVSPVKVEREISQLQDEHSDLEARCDKLLALLQNRLALWRRFERQLEMVHESVQEADYMMELLTVQGSVDYDRLLKATERLEVSTKI